MPIRCKCEHCGKGGRVPDTYAGMVINCPACGETMAVPTLEEAAAAENAAAGAAKPAAPKPASQPPTVVERAPKPAAPAPRNPQPPTVLDRAPPEATAPKPAAPKPAAPKPAAPTVFEKGPVKGPAPSSAPAKPAPPKSAPPTVFEKAPAKPAPARDSAPAKDSAPTVFEKKPPAKPAAPTLFEKREEGDLPDLAALDLSAPGGEAPPMIDLGDFEESAKPAAKPTAPKPAPTQSAAPHPAPAKTLPAKPALELEPAAKAAPASSILDDEADAKPTPAATADKSGPNWVTGPLVDLGLAVAAAGLAALVWLGTERPPLARPVASATVGAAPSASFKVEIDAQNVVKVNGSPVAGPEAVAAALESAGAPSQVLIQVSGDALYGTIERVISAAGRGGAVSVQLATLE